MRRVILAIVSTAAALVLLLTFKTHSTSAIATPPAAISGTGGTGNASGSAGTSGSGFTITSTSGASTSKGKSTASKSTPSQSTPSQSTPSQSTPSQSTSSGSGISTVSKTVTGDAANTIYGPVQVQITVKSSKVTAVQAVQYPDGSPHDQQINAYAIPVLNQEALAAGSAHIDAVSGATYTSNGYITSLQSAIDKAGL
jgi:uncharacterized protein with FMN-binding domain